MITGMAHVCLGTTDLAAVEKFYCECLGFRKVFDFKRDDKVVGFYLEIVKGSYLEFFVEDRVDLEAKSPIRHYCLEVDDIDEVGKRLTDHGYKATKKALGSDQSWQIWTTDPTGINFEFHQYTENSSQITGRDCAL